MLKKPAINEYASFYETYISKVPDENLLGFLDSQLKEYENIIQNCTPENLDHRYEEGKWTIREVIVHVVDCEKIFAYRAVAGLRGEKQGIPGFDQNEYAANANVSHLTKQDLLDLLTTTRKSCIVLFKTVADDDWTKTVNASNYDASIRALAYMIAGHAEHHLRILKERYL